MAGKFRATIWYLSAAAAAVEGNAGIRRYIVEHEAQDVEDFKAMVMDAATRHVDDSIEFGPITTKKVRG